MKTLLVLAFIAPVTSWAQAKSAAAKPVVPTRQQSQSLQGLVNPRLLVVPTGRFLYRTLRDTLGNHYASPLPGGEWTLDIVRFLSPHWLTVRWRPGSAQFVAGDTATYYLPREGVRTIILL
jgi:hypothetical protein